MSKKIKERKIISIAAISTIVIIIGFTLSQGQLKNNDNKYVSKIQEDIALDYSILNEIKEEDKIVYNVHCSDELNPEAISKLTSEIIEEKNKDKKSFKIFLFTKLEKANSLKIALEENEEINYSTQAEKVIIPTDDNNIKITSYYEIPVGMESIPKDYEVLSIKENEGNTQIEAIIQNITNEAEALAQIKFLGESIRELNADKSLGVLNIKAYSTEYKDEAWEYDGNNKTIVTRNYYQTIN